MWEGLPHTPVQHKLPAGPHLKARERGEVRHAARVDRRLASVGRGAELGEPRQQRQAAQQQRLVERAPKQLQPLQRWEGGQQRGEPPGRAFKLVKGATDAE